MNIKFFLILLIMSELNVSIMLNGMEASVLPQREKVLEKLKREKTCLELKAAIQLADLPMIEEALKNGALTHMSIWKRVTRKQLPLYPIELFTHESNGSLLKETRLQIIKLLLEQQAVQSNITNSLPLKFVIKKQLQHNDYSHELFELLLQKGYAQFALSVKDDALLTPDKSWGMEMSSDEVHQKMIKCLFYRLLERYGNHYKTQNTATASKST